MAVCNKKIILDLGAHKGEDSDFYLQKGFKVIAVEASDFLYKKIIDRFKDYYNETDCKILNYAIYDKDNELLDFYENEQYSVWGTVFNSWDSRNKKFGTGSVKTTATSIRLDTLIKQEIKNDETIEYLKIDIEGADVMALQSLLNISVRPCFISLESEKISWPRLKEEFSLLNKLGYHKFKIIDQSNINKQQCPYPSKEGNYVDYKFEKGSTGLFGNDLPGKWLSATEAKNAYRKIFIRYKLFGDYGIFNNKLVMQNYYVNRFMHLCKLKFPQVGWYDTHAALNPVD